MPGQDLLPGSLLLSAALLVGGCARTDLTVASAFPQAARAAPWILAGAVWGGTLDEAAAALGPDADRWRPLEPAQVWLAVYRHEGGGPEKLVIRAFAFAGPEAARRAYEHFRPPDAAEFRAGDAGCWTGSGVLFVWRRLVFEIFGSEAGLQSEIESARLTAFIQKQMPPGLPDAPR